MYINLTTNDGELLYRIQIEYNRPDSDALNIAKPFAQSALLAEIIHEAEKSAKRKE